MLPTVCVQAEFPLLVFPAEGKVDGILGETQSAVDRLLVGAAAVSPRSYIHEAASVTILSECCEA